VRNIEKILYALAGMLGVLSLGVEWRARQSRRQSLLPKPPSNAGLLVGLWACAAALTGKVIEDRGRQAATTGTPPGTFVPTLGQKRARTLRSEYDLSDQYLEHLTNRRQPAGIR
jgi:hypothetical protein